MQLKIWPFFWKFARFSGEVKQPAFHAWHFEPLHVWWRHFKSYKSELDENNWYLCVFINPICEYRRDGIENDTSISTRRKTDHQSWVVAEFGELKQLSLRDLSNSSIACSVRLPLKGKSKRKCHLSQAFVKDWYSKIWVYSNFHLAQIGWTSFRCMKNVCPLSGWVIAIGTVKRTDVRKLGLPPNRSPNNCTESETILLVWINH